MYGIMNVNMPLMLPGFPLRCSCAGCYAMGASAVILQDNSGDVCHPVCYFSVKFKRQQLNYSTIDTLLLTRGTQGVFAACKTLSLPIEKKQEKGACKRHFLSDRTLKQLN